MNYILIIGTFEAIFLILLLLSKKNKTRSDLFLGIILSLYASSIFTTYIEIYNIQNNFPYPQIINLNWLIMFLHGPALWFYIKSLSSPVFRFKLTYLLHFIPFLAFLIAHYFNFINLPAVEKIHIAKSELFKDQAFYKISVLSIGISTISYNLWALKLIQKHRHNLLFNFSKIEDIDLNWLRILTIASLICFGVNHALFNLDLIFHYASHKILSLTVYSFASVYILVIGYFGLQQKKVFVNRDIENQLTFDKSARIKRSGTSRKEDNEFINILLSFMEQKQPFLDPEITISKLSELLKVKTEYLSEILNLHLNRTFFDFINKYRVEEFKVQCVSETNSHLSIMGIAYNCGFNSKASFYRAFNKFEGISPSAYIQNVSQNSETAILGK
ncbi:MAG: helix-turn-helix domain-containing protein [Bacteroidetes bacterium]|nr:helix-turn-helix domain-containing protein [Bacteroidota bacterium]